MYVFLVETSPHAKKNKTHILPVGVFQYLPVLELFQLYYLPQYNYDNLWTTPYLSWNHLEKSACQLSYFFFFSLMTLLYNSPVYICFIYVEIEYHKKKYDSTVLNIPVFTRSMCIDTNRLQV